MAIEIGGLLTRALGNFWCIRGYATLGDLARITRPDASFQRDLIQSHREEITAFLADRRFLFFPEVILGADLAGAEDMDETLDDQLEPLLNGDNRLDLGAFVMKARRIGRRSARDVRGADDIVHVTLTSDEKGDPPFSRIDGNHRISAAMIEEHPEFRDIVCPFVLVLFRNKRDSELYSRAIFHNVNAKSIPLRLEQNLRLILDDELLFSDADLKASPSFGWPYYLARRIGAETRTQLSWLPALKPVFENPDWRKGQPESERYDLRSRLVELFRLLLAEGLLAEDEASLDRARKAISVVHSLYSANPALPAGKNAALFAVLVAHELRAEKSASFIVRWALENQISNLRTLEAGALYQVVQAILSARKRKIFVSMPFGVDVTDGHWIVIKEVCEEFNTTLALDPKLVVERVDLFADGTSYVISDKILEMIDGCGLLIADLTRARPNVYHEVGVVMGRNRALGIPDNLLMILREEAGITEPVAFNLRGMRQVRFKHPHELKPQLQTELRAWFKI